MKKTLKNLLSEIIGLILTCVGRNIASKTIFTKNDWSILIRLKITGARERGLFSLYICIETFKNLLVWNH